MRKIRSLSILTSVIILVVASFCEKDPSLKEPVPSYSAYERTIRDKYDILAVFRWTDYIKLLEKLSEDKFIVLPLNEMRKTFDSTRVVVGLRHDVDLNPLKALEMAKIESMYAIRSTYFFLATADYFGKFENSSFVRWPETGNLIKEIHKTGSEIGIHNDLLSVMIKYKFDPFIFNRDEIAYYRSLKIRIYGTASHGSPIARATLPNYNIFSDFAVTDTLEYDGKKYPIGIHSLKDFGFQYEAYKIPYNKYYSDSGGKWNDQGGLESIMNKLESSKPGDRVEILVHPDWWGKNDHLETSHQ